MNKFITDYVSYINDTNIKIKVYKWLDSIFWH